MLDCTISFYLWWTMVKMAIYTQKYEQKWLKINNRGVGIKMSWVKKNRKINNRGRDDYSGLARVAFQAFKQGSTVKCSYNSRWILVEKSRILSQVLEYVLLCSSLGKQIKTWLSLFICRWKNLFGVPDCIVSLLGKRCFWSLFLYKNAI